VSYQTVSKVVNHQTQVSPPTEERIWQAVRALGYHPDHHARNLRTQRSQMLGYSWAPSPPDQANPILDAFLQGMMEAAERAGYHVLPFSHRQVTEHIATYRELIGSGRVDGFILSSVEFNDPRIIFLLEQNVPFVAFGRSNPEWNYSYVDVDGAAGLRMATEHLLARGHRRIAALAWPPSSRVGNDRLSGYLRALGDAGITPDPEWIARGEGRVAFGRAATVRWLELPVQQRPTAVVALSDAMAIGAMRAAQERGLRVGKDFAVTGFDDAPMVQYLTPALTTVRQPIREVGQQVISILVSLLADERPAENQIVLQPQLIVRESSGASDETNSTTTHSRAAIH
jgi:DNA-binding LacI/PurR family transcriptional regulator